MTPVAVTKKEVPSPDEFISRCEQEHGILKSLYADLLTAYNQGCSVLRGKLGWHA